MARYPPDEVDTAFAKRLVREARIAPVPGNGFYTDEDDSGWLRFTFSRDGATIEEAIPRLEDDRWW